MALRISSNGDAAMIHRTLSSGSERLARSIERLSAGLKMNRASDDVERLDLAERMRSQIEGLQRAERNSQDGISLLQTADGALSQVHSILQRARELAVRYNSGTLDANSKHAITSEMIALSNEIGKIMQLSKYDGTPLLQTGIARVTLQIGAYAGESVSFALATLMGPINSLVQPNTFSLGAATPADIASLDKHIDDVGKARARFGAVVNRLEATLDKTARSREGLLDARSRITDVDFAKEHALMTTQQLLQETTQAALLYASQSPARLLNLLGNR